MAHLKKYIILILVKFSFSPSLCISLQWLLWIMLMLSSKHLLDLISPFKKAYTNRHLNFFKDLEEGRNKIKPFIFICSILFF